MDFLGQLQDKNRPDLWSKISKAFNTRARERNRPERTDTAIRQKLNNKTHYPLDSKEDSDEFARLRNLVRRNSLDTLSKHYALDSSSGTGGGGSNWTDPQLTRLSTLVKELTPLTVANWSPLMERYNEWAVENGYPERTASGLKKKFEKMLRTRPTGDNGQFSERQQQFIDAQNAINERRNLQYLLDADQEDSDNEILDDSEQRSADQFGVTTSRTQPIARQAYINLQRGTDDMESPSPRSLSSSSSSPTTNKKATVAMDFRTMLNTKHETMMIEASIRQKQLEIQEKQLEIQEKELDIKREEIAAKERERLDSLKLQEKKLELESKRAEWMERILLKFVEKEMSC